MDALIVQLDATWVDLPGGWVTVIAVLLTTVVGPIATIVVTARLSGRVKAIRSDVAVTKEHVANSHVDEHGEPINMREEQDRYQAELVGKLNEIQSTQRGQARDIGGIRAEMRQLREADLEHTRTARENREHITALEQTIPTRPRPQKPKESSK